MTENINDATTPKPRGGPRPGSGRKPGSKNRKTLKREKKLQEAVAEALSDIATDEQIADADPREALEFCLRCHWRAGDLDKLAAVAGVLMAYTHSKVATAEKTDPLPEDLQPDPKPEPDDSDVPAEVVE